jgi:hypothetical protein
MFRRPVILSGSIADYILLNVFGNGLLNGMIRLLGCGLGPVAKLKNSNLYLSSAKFPTGRFTGQVNVQPSALNLASRVCHHVFTRITSRPHDFDS